MSSIIRKLTGPKRTRWMAGAAALCLAGLGGWLACLLCGDAPRAWRGLLIAFIYFTPLSAGLLVWSPIVLTSRGTWLGPIERFNLAGVAFSIPSLAGLSALWIGAAHWAPWVGRTLPQSAWLSKNFLFGRDLAALALFWALAHWYAARRREGEGLRIGPFLIAAYAVVFTLLGNDLVMALDPTWATTLFGAYFFISGLYIAICAWALLAALDAAERGRLHDLGKLLVTFSLLTTYLMFSHLLLIWYENLPRETSYLVLRMNFYPWRAVSMALVALVYLGPLLMLLTVRAKRSGWFLGMVSVILLVGLWVERWWLVAPQFSRELRLGAPEVSISLAALGALAFGLLGLLRPAPAAQAGRR